MEKQYHKTIIIAMCVSAALILGACSSNLSYNEALQRNVKEINDSEKLEDARFLLEAASYNMLATQLGEAAVESGYSASVVAMAKSNVEQHEEMEREIRKLARREDIVLPGEMKSEHERILNELKAADRREFDRAYVRLLREVSQEDRDKFATMATEAQSEDIRSFAARKLDLFEAHQDQLETVDRDLLRTY